MKKLLSLIFLFNVFVIYAQDKNASQKNEKHKEDKEISNSKTIIINPFGIDSSVNVIKYGSRVKFKILNVNTFKVKGDLTSTTWNFESTIPSVFNKILELADSVNKSSVTEPDVKALGFNAENKNSKDLEKYLEAIKLQQKDEFISTFREFLKTCQQITLIANLEDRLKANLSDSLFVRDTAVLKAKCVSLYKSVYANQVNSANPKICISNYLNDIHTYFAKLKSIYEALQENVKPETGLLSGKLENKDKSGSVTIKDATFTISKKKYFESEFEFAKKINDELSVENTQKEFTNKAYAGIDLYNEILTCDFTYYTPSEAVTSDEVTFTPTLTTASGKSTYEFKSFKIRAKGGIKVNFSSGYLLSLTGDDNYSTFRDTAGNVAGISKGNSNNVTHSIGALAHVYCRNAKDYNIAISPGLSLSANGSLGFYFGVSAMFIEKNRLVITLGASYIQKQILNTSNLNSSGGDRYTFLSASDNEIKYDKVYKPTLFIGVTYNIWDSK